MSDSNQDSGSFEKQNGVESNAGRGNSKRYRNMSSSSSTSDESESSRHRYSYRDYNRRETVPPTSASSSSRHAKSIPSAHSSSSRYEKSRTNRHNDHARKYSGGQDRLQQQQQSSIDVAASSNIDLSTSNDTSSVTSRIQNRLGRKNHHQQEQQPQIPLDAITKELLSNLMYSNMPLGNAGANYIEPYNPVPLKGCPNSIPSKFLFIILIISPYNSISF